MIIEFKGKDYFIYYIGVVLFIDGKFSGGCFCCLVVIDLFYYNEDGMFKCVVMIMEGI